MNDVLNPLVDNAVLCWGCPVFDRLFQVVSYSAAAVYNKLTIFCAILFCVLLAFFIMNAVWKNIKGNISDPWYKKSIQPVIINSLVALTLLGMGVTFPRFITSITFEPVTDIALIYTQTMLETNPETVNEKVPYTPQEISGKGFYRPELRDKIILLMKTTITQFQSYIKLGIAVMDKAFSYKALLGVGALIQHITLFFIGLYLAYGFFKLFLRFCFYFADIIVAMTFFAFFFPLSLILIAFKGADAPSWISALGKNIGTNQFKKLINAIITLAAAVLTYIVIMVIIAKFFSPDQSTQEIMTMVLSGDINTSAPGQSTQEIMTMILSGDIYADALSSDNLASITLVGSIILLYVVNFLYDQIPQVTSMVLSTFGVSQENELSEKLANKVMQVTSNAVGYATAVGKTILNKGEKNKENKDTKDKTDNKTK